MANVLIKLSFPYVQCNNKVVIQMKSVYKKLNPF